MTTSSLTSQPDIDAFIDAVWLEDGLAKNTLAAYRRDLTAFAQWLENPAEHGGAATASQLRGAVTGDIAAWFAARHEESRATTANRRLAALRRFYAWALREHRAEKDPCLTLTTAKQPPRMPKTLSEAQVEALLAAPDLNTARGLRDRAMLETLYATGLRVSELVNVKVLEISLNEGVVRVVMGKGGKDRLVPLGAEAAHWIERYMQSARPELAGAKVSDALFLTARAQPMSPRCSHANAMRSAGSKRAGRRKSASSTNCLRCARRCAKPPTPLHAMTSSRASRRSNRVSPNCRPMRR